MKPVIAGVLKVDKQERICYNVVVSKKTVDNKAVEIHAYITLRFAVLFMHTFPNGGNSERLGRTLLHWNGVLSR